MQVRINCSKKFKNINKTMEGLEENLMPSDRYLVYPHKRLITKVRKYKTIKYFNKILTAQCDNMHV